MWYCSTMLTSWCNMSVPLTRNYKGISQLGCRREGMRLGRFQCAGMKPFTNLNYLVLAVLYGQDTTNSFDDSDR